MAFEGGANEITLEKTSIIHTNKYNNDPQNADKVTWIVKDTGVTTDHSGRLDRSGTKYNLAGDAKTFYTTSPGIYSFDYEALVDGVLVAKQPQQIRIIDQFRRYLVPTTHCIVDVNKPVYLNEINVVVGEKLEFLVVHPTLDSDDSNVGVSVNVLASSSKYTITEYESTAAGNPVYKVVVDFTEANSNGYDIEFTFLPFDTSYEMLSIVPSSFKVKVYDSPIAVTTTPAILDDSTIRLLYSSYVFEEGFTATVKTVGKVGSLSGDLTEGQTVQVNTGGPEVVNIVYDLQDSVTPASSSTITADSGTAPTMAEIDVDVVLAEQLVNDLSSQGLYGKSKIIDEDATSRYVFHSIPLSIPPANVPTISGYPTVIPYYFYVEDTQTSQVGAYPYELKIGFNSTLEGLKIAVDISGDDNYTMYLNYVYQADALLTNTVHKIFLVLPGNGGRSDTLRVNGYKLYTFSTQYVNMGSFDFNEACEWVSLGNFVHKIFGPSNDGVTPNRANVIANSANKMYITNPYPGNIKEYYDSGIGACGTVAMAAAYLIGASGFCNYQYADGVAANFDPLLMESEDFCFDISDGLDFGLPFGKFTNWLTVTDPEFVSNPSKLSYAVALNGDSLECSHALCTVEMGASLFAVIDSAGIYFGSSVETALLSSPVIRAMGVLDVDVMGFGVGIDKKAIWSLWEEESILHWDYPGLLPNDALIPSYDPDTGELVLRDTSYDIIKTVVGPSDLVADNATQYADGFCTIFGGYQGYWAAVGSYGEILYRGSNVPAGGYVDSWFNQVVIDPSVFDSQFVY